MTDRVPIPAQELVTWDFTVARQGFMVRYGHAGGNFYKQDLTQGGAPISYTGVKRVTKRTYNLAKKLHEKS